MAEWTTPDAVHSECGEQAGHESGYAKDDDTGTYWRHAVACFHWIIFDMGESKTITKIQLYQSAIIAYRWGADGANAADYKGLTVYVSDDPENWGDAVWEGDLNSSGWVESGAFSKVGRYIKLVSKSDHASQRMYEFQAYAEAIKANLVPVGDGLAFTIHKIG